MTAPKSVSKQHVIAKITYVKSVPAELAPLDCVCGWHGRAADFSEHRKQMGARSNKAALSSHPHTIGGLG